MWIHDRSRIQNATLTSSFCPLVYDNISLWKHLARHNVHELYNCLTNDFCAFRADYSTHILPMQFAITVRSFKSNLQNLLIRRLINQL